MCAQEAGGHFVSSDKKASPLNLLCKKPKRHPVCRLAMYFNHERASRYYELFLQLGQSHEFKEDILTMVDGLLRSGHNINALDADGEGPLHKAACWCARLVAHLLKNVTIL